MTIEIRIVPFIIEDVESRAEAEEKLATLLNDRWGIIAQGGNDSRAYFVLQKGEAKNTRPFPFGKSES